MFFRQLTYERLYTQNLYLSNASMTDIPQRKFKLTKNKPQLLKMTGVKYLNNLPATAVFLINVFNVRIFHYLNTTEVTKIKLCNRIQANHLQRPSAFFLGCILLYFSISVKEKAYLMKFWCCFYSFITKFMLCYFFITLA